MRRIRVEKGVYISERVNGWVYEIGWYDADGKQRWMVVGQDLLKARQLREQYVQNRVGGASKYKQIRKDLFEIAAIADRHNAPTKQMILNAMKATTSLYPRKAWLTLAGLALAQARRYESHQVSEKHGKMSAHGSN